MLVGFGLLEFIHKDLYLAAEQIVRNSHLNPASHYFRIFIDAANHMTNGKLWAMAFSALLYSVIRFVEAIALSSRQRNDRSGRITRLLTFVDVDRGYINFRNAGLSRHR